MKNFYRSVIVILLSIGMLGFINGCASPQATKTKSGTSIGSSHSKASSAKLKTMGDLCDHSLALARLAKGNGTKRDISWRAGKINALAKKLKYGSVGFYAKQLNTAATAGDMKEVKATFKQTVSSVAASLKLDKSKKYGKCSCKVKFSCKIKKKKK